MNALWIRPEPCPHGQVPSSHVAPDKVDCIFRHQDVRILAGQKSARLEGKKGEQIGVRKPLICADPPQLVHQSLAKVSKPGVPVAVHHARGL